ncbi:GNAT family N-acetyltransferase [Actinomadura fibrosa]|uniref:GNAT family N-acetyltransferase n=1 Tax=Actinomadura fibrosa TaxID=111802 RepID=A0ABW2XB77_9ACTN|nr:GNAT family N-acetyltransferase [Actinomadura fibrosa]
MKQLDVRSVAHIAAALARTGEPPPSASGTPRPPALEDVRIRPYGVTDRERLGRMAEHLSKASLYTRFFSGTPRLPDHWVGTLENLDHWDREALVALLAGEVIGVAEYIRDVRRPARADIAVLIADPWQRRGLGSRLVAYLAELAGRRGVTEFDADVILGNREAILAIRSNWPAVRSSSADGAAHFRLPLPMPAPA